VEKMVIYRDNQELQADDFLNQQGWAQQALDHVVLDAINTDKAYAGFRLTKAAATTIKTSPGRLYSGGLVYAREDEVSLDLYNQLPVTARKYFAVIAWGQSVDEDIQPRNYLLDADTGMAEPQSVAMQRTRYCNVSTVGGTESADPQFPPVDATYCVLGYVLCDPAGIVSFLQETSTQLDNLELMAARVKALEQWRAIAQGMIETLRTDLANLAAQLLNYTLLTQFQQLVDIVNELWELAHRPAGFKFYGNDRFLEDGLSDTASVFEGAYSAKVDEGLRFPGGGAGWIGKIALGNPSEPVIQSWDGFMLPKPSGSRVRYDCSFPDLPWTPVRVLSWGFNNNISCRQLTPSRWRFRCGLPYIPFPASSVWWFEAQRDPTYQILSFTGEVSFAQSTWSETMLRDEESVYYPRHGYDRWKYYWRDWVEHAYWAKVYSDFTHTGNHGAQVFYNAQDGWLSGITVFAHRQLNQPLTLVISGCANDGTPDHNNHTLRRVVLDATSITQCYGQPIYAGDIIETGIVTKEMYIPYAETNAPPGSILTSPKSAIVYQQVFKAIPTYIYPLRINFPPVFLTQGKHFAIHAVSTFDHEFSFCDKDDAYQVCQGQFWYYEAPNFKMWPSGPRVMRFQAHFATWGRWGGQTSPGGQLRYEVTLQPLILAGGIGAIDVLAETIIPAATDLHFEVQVGGVWKPFQQDFALSDTTGALQFRVVFTGTTDLMPGVSQINSEIELTKAAALTFHHVSKPVVVTGGSTQPRVITKLLNFQGGAVHTCAVKVSAGGAASVAGTDADELLDDGTLVRTTTFTTASNTSFRVIINGTTNGVATPFVVGERIFFAV
jgi:hypothetical protein